MLPDPLPIGASFVLAADMPAISREAGKSIYNLVVSDVAYKATISHSENKGRRRSIVRLDATQVVADPYVAANSVEDTASAYLVIDRSLRLSTDGEVVSLVTELLGVLEAADQTNITTTRIAAIVGGQS